MERDKSDKIFTKAVVLGAGRWGSAMAIYLQRIGFKTAIYSHSLASAQHILQHNQSPHLKNYYFEKDLTVYNDINQAVLGRDLLFIAIPSPFLAASLAKITDLAKKIPIIGINKGIASDSLKIIPEVVQEFFPDNPYLHLGGPCFPGGLLDLQSLVAETLAGRDHALAVSLQQRLNSAKLRIYLSTDVTGVAYLGAIKNVFAIAAGVIEGKRLNPELKSILITRGLTEIKRLGQVLPIQTTSIYGLSGLGDLVLTCYNSQSSHNCRFGKLIAERNSIQQALSAMDLAVPEGYHTARALFQIAKRENIEAPLITAVYKLLYEHKPLAAILQELMLRPLTSE